MILQIALKPKFLADFMKSTDFIHTGPAENFNSLRLKYCPKRTHFTPLGMEIRAILAALDNNNNTGKKLSVTFLNFLQNCFWIRINPMYCKLDFSEIQGFIVLFVVSCDILKKIIVLRPEIQIE